MKPRVTVIARADLTGLGVQSRNWVRLLNPNKVVVIDSRPFNKNDQHFEWYSSRKNVSAVYGFIKNHEINPILEDTDVLITFESTYNYQLLTVARRRGIKTILQNNWEFTDYLKNPALPMPDLLVNHSYWHLHDQSQLWPEITDYCPTPLFIEDFKEISEENESRIQTPMRFVHIAGRQTHEGRNGTHDLIQAIKLIPEDYDFELVIKVQNSQVEAIDDPRVTIDRSSPVDEKELYRNFDAMIMPRRYAGACLPMNEALASSLPVIMTDIDPNNKVLPEEWLVPADKKTVFMARTLIDVYSADHEKLAEKIIEFSELSQLTIDEYKKKAKEIAVKEFSSESVKKRWDSFMKRLGF